MIFPDSTQVVNLWIQSPVKLHTWFSVSILASWRCKELSGIGPVAARIVAAKAQHGQRQFLTTDHADYTDAELDCLSESIWKAPRKLGGSCHLITKVATGVVDGTIRLTGKDFGHSVGERGLRLASTQASRLVFE